MAGNTLTFRDLDGAGHRPLRLLRDLFAALSDGVAAYRRYHALSALGDRTLARAGLEREDIVREAMFPSGRFSG